MGIKVIFDSQCFSSKPEGYEVGRIINRMSIDTVKECSIEKIKESILQGKTIRPAYCGGKENSWVSQQMFMIDVDNNLTIEQAIEKCNQIQITPNFVYTSFSHKEEHHKFRLVFVMDKEIIDFSTAKKIQVYLMDSIGGVDEKCKNLNRVYFAGKKIVSEIGTVLNAEQMIEDSKNVAVKDKDLKGVISRVRNGVPDNNDNNNLPILSSTPKTSYSESDNYTIKAIANREVEFLKGKYGSGDKKVFETNQEFIDFIRTEIDLGDFLEFHYPKSIKCIFHDDKKNSAGIFQADDGAWIYKCFGCGVTYNIVGVIERLANFKSRPKTYKFIKEIFNLEIMETQWQKEQKEILLENLQMLNNGEFESNCPLAYKKIRGIKHYLENLILIAMNHVHSETLTDKDGQVAFFASARFICKQMGISLNSTNKIYQKLAILSYYKLINKLNDDEIPERFLKRAKAININVNDNKYNHINFISIPAYTVNKFLEIEQRGQAWKENHYTMKDFRRETLYRSEGSNIADESYPQRKNVTEEVDGENQVVARTTTEESDRMTNNIVQAIHDLINERGYATEKAVEEQLKSKYTSYAIQTQIKMSLKEICDSYDLRRVRANKEIKKQFGITAKGYPFIIVQNE